MGFFDNQIGLTKSMDVVFSSKIQQRTGIELEEFNLKKSVWYNKQRSVLPAGFFRKIGWKYWVLFLLLFLGFIAYQILSSPYTPNPLLLFYRPSSRIETGNRPGDWATYARTPAHQRFLNRNVSFKGIVRWSLAQSGEVDSSPAVVDGVLYVGGDSKVFALDVLSGKPIWTYQTTGPVNSSPAVADDLLFLGLLDGRVIALNRHSGELKWQFKTGNYIIGSPTVVNGLLHIGSADGKIYTLDARLGTLVWQVQTDGTIIHAPAVQGETVYATSMTKKLHSLSARTGARRLEYFLSGNLIDTPVITANTVYFVASDGRLIALKHKARQYPWSHAVKVAWIQLWMLGFPLSTPTPQPGTLWGTFPIEKKSRFVSSPVVTGDRLFLGDNRGRFYALDAHKGSPLWVIEPGEAIATAPLILGDTVYFGTKTGKIFGVDRHDGSLQWKFVLGSPLKGELIYAAGMMFVRTTDGMVHAIE
jgi:outer membrane protein assembly factor BamB